jgi:glycosyltransferase involved in cell wall biosynthesis
LVYYGIDNRFANNQFSAPNLLFLALASARPILTTDVGEIAAIVRSHQCGTILTDLEVTTIQRALSGYLQGDLWQRQSEQSFQAATIRYNWDSAKQNLVNLYRRLEREVGT